MKHIDVAENFIYMLGKMKYEELTSLIHQEIGEELLLFIEGYAKELAQVLDENEKILTAMIIIGYLLKGQLKSIEQIINQEDKHNKYVKRYYH